MNKEYKYKKSDPHIYTMSALNPFKVWVVIAEVVCHITPVLRFARDALGGLRGYTDTDTDNEATSRSPLS